ncbi:unnamed protein product [Arabis nemorensis]|uniref:DUF4408 domain-containing protein n=1 Tax=Arabis nemorensis TaxID=586526 RepID=A0A565B111_9BRAS|nr:unnamed protein product [Arabis nemorensis]
MKKPFDEIHGVEAEKAEAMRRYKNRRTFRNILRSLAVALLCYLWFPMVRIAGNWFYRTGSVMLTNRIFVFFLVNLLVVLIFVLSRDDERDCSGGSETEPDLYDRYTSSSAVIVTASSGEKVEEDDSKKQIVPEDEIGEEEEEGGVHSGEGVSENGIGENGDGENE